MNLQGFLQDFQALQEGITFLRGGLQPTFFVFWQLCLMTHPLVPQIIDLAVPIAESLGLQVVGATFHTNQRPPVLRVDISNPEQDTSLNDCEQMSRALEPVLDESGIISDTYVLEVSSPGISRLLSTDREFISFKGFPVTVTTSEAETGQQEQTGLLIRRDDESLYLNLKGRTVTIPRHLIIKVQLADGIAH